MYAIVKTGGKQYRVRQGQTLLVERLPAPEGETVDLAPLLYVDGEELVDGDGLSAVSVQARVVAHERGPKLRVVKFKPKRGYRRRTGHRQDLTRIEITTLGRTAGGAGASSGAKRPARRAAASSTGEPTTGAAASAGEPAGGASPTTRERGRTSDGA